MFVKLYNRELIINKKNNNCQFRNVYKKIFEESMGINLNEINLKYKVKKGESKVNIFGSSFVEKNKHKCKIIYNDKESELVSILKVKNNNKNKIKIKLKGIKNLTDVSEMFSGCKLLKSLPDISKLNICKISKMNRMFFECTSLKNISDISNLHIDNISDISLMFYGCSSLKSLPDISKWKTDKINNISGMFCGCSSLIFFLLIKLIMNIHSNWKIDEIKS